MILTETLSRFKNNLNELLEAKQAGKTFANGDQRVNELAKRNIELLFSAKSGMRNVIDTVETLKRKSQTQGGATDEHNLTLQSHLYEISHYKKQIDACQEFKTPELDKVIEKAAEMSQNNSHEEGLQRLKELSKGISA